jgi:hypothetical protein
LAQHTFAVIVFERDRALSVATDTDDPEPHLTLAALGHGERLPLWLTLDRKAASELAHALDSFIRTTTPAPTVEKTSPKDPPIA